MWNEIINAVEKAVLYIFQPEERIFYPYLLSSLFIAALIFLAEHKSVKGIIKYLFPVKRLFHISSVNDFALLVINHVINTLFLLPFVISSVKLAYYFSEWINSVIGHSSGQISVVQISILYALTFFIVNDFTRYLLHLLLHKIPFLWEFHKVHHSAEVMTPITLYRSHPVESILSQLRGVFVGGFISGIFLWIYPYSISVYMVFGVHVGTFLFNLLGANLRHSHVWWSFGKNLGKIFISPAQHLIHHSNKPEHYNKNMGSELAIWDWMFATLYLTEKKENLQFGIEEKETKEHRNIFKMIINPFMKGFKINPKRER